MAMISLLILMVSNGSPAEHRRSGTVKPGDTLMISVWKEPDLRGDVLITPDGAFAFPLVGQVDGSGKTVTESAEDRDRQIETIHL
jgi:polysaccharide export outer membrane protein